MLKYLKKNKIIVACFVLFALLYFYGNNMEFYESVETSLPKKINEPSNLFKLSSTDDIVLERTDLAQLKAEKINKRNFNGYDGFPTVLKGWWADSSAVADNLYTPPSRMIWPD